jgi:hypothetical protein
VGNLILLLGELAGPSPNPFLAFTVKVYVCPAVKPVTVIGELALLAVILLGLLIAVYCIIGIPPVDVGDVNDTITELVDAVVIDVIVGTLNGIGFITILIVII